MTANALVEYGRGMGGDLSAGQNQRVRAAAWAWIRADRRRSKAALAKALGISQASVGRILNRNGGASHGTTERLAALLGTSKGALIGSRGDDAPDPHPARAALLADVANGGRWSPATVSAIMAVRVRGYALPSRAGWELALDLLDAMVRGLENDLSYM